MENLWKGFSWKWQHKKPPPPHIRVEGKLSSELGYDGLEAGFDIFST